MTGPGARVLTFTVLVACLLCSLWAAVPSTPSYDPAADRPALMRDAELYRAIASSVAEGESYYRAALSLQRQNGFPVKPFFTVRLPTLTMLVASLGPALPVLAWGLFLAIVVLWHRRLGEESATVRLSSVAPVAILGGSMLYMDALMFADVWCGLLVSLALTFRTTSTRAGAALAALAFREFAAGFAAICLLKAIAERDRRATIIAAGGLLIFALGIACHALMITGLVHAGDVASQGWMGLLGPSGVIDAIRLTTPLHYLPYTVAACIGFLPLLGWLDHDRVAFAWFLGMVALLAIVARPDNFYWAGAMLPLYFAGLAFVPRALRSLKSGAISPESATSRVS